MSCDILMCSENASLGLPEVDVGLMGGGRHAMRVCGHSLTRRMMLTGDRISGPELYRRGIVEECVPLDQLMTTAMAMATRIAAKSPLASRTAPGQILMVPPKVLAPASVSVPSVRHFS